MFDNWGDQIEIVQLGDGAIEVRFRGAGTMELSPRRARDFMALLTAAVNEAEREGNGSRVH